MGCDIHAHIEWRGAPYPGQWWHFAAVHIDRWYALFAAMAGVRAHEDSPPPVAPVRSLPSDATSDTREDFGDYEHDAHSASWLTADEFREALRRTGEDDTGTAQATLAAMDSLAHGGRREARLVFWFDN